MSNYNIEPWHSTYKMLGEEKPKKLRSKFSGREVGAFRTMIPPKTIEPPQIHLNAPRDGNPFEELLTDFDKDFLVVYFDMKTKKKVPVLYQPGQDIIIPQYQIHWLVNKHNVDLEFTCEYAPHPWDGDNDEPEFKDISTLLQFIENKGLTQKLIESSNFL